MPLFSRRRSPSLGLRVFLGAVGMLVVVLAVAFALLSRWSRDAAEESMRRGLEQSADLVAQFLAGRQRSLVGGARVFVQGPYFRAIVAERRRDDILDQAFEAAAQLDADWVFVVNERGILMAKSDEPGASGVDLGGVALVRGALRGQVTSGFGVSRDSLLFQAAAIPIAVPGGAPIGVLVATKLVDSVLAHDVKAVTASDIVFFVRDAAGTPRVAASTLGASPARRLMRVAGIGAGAPGAPAVPSRVDLGGPAYAIQTGGLTTAGGDAVGGFAVLREAGTAGESAAAVRHALLVAGLTGLLLAALAAMLAWRRIADPIERLTLDAHRAAESDAVTLAVDDITPRSDEIGRLGQALRALASELRDRTKLAGITSFAPADTTTTSESTTSPGIARPPSVGRRGTLALGRRHDPLPAIASTDGLTIGAVLNRRYVIDALVGSGTSATVYRAVDRMSQEVCAVKLFPHGVAVT